MWCCDTGHVVPHILKVCISFICMDVESVEPTSVWHVVILLKVMNCLSTDSTPCHTPEEFCSDVFVTNRMCI